jgi:DNA-binding LacI/PurR family transcriptional regulator
MARARIQDVARLADVSLSTVSAVLNGKDIVREETKRRILEVIERLDYHPDLYASNLARRQRRVLGLIVSNLVNPFFAETAQSFEREAHRRGYQVSLASTGFSSSQLRISVEQMLGMRVAGLAVMTSEFDAKAFQLLQSSRTPTVFLDVGTPGPRISNIRVDTKSGMVLAVRHLVSLGHRDILLICNSQKGEIEPALLSHRYRSEGFMAAIEKYHSRGARAHIFDAPGPGAHAGLKAIQSALRSDQFTAVVAITDLVALGACRGLHSAGMRIPQDVSVVGFDNTYICEFTNPPLTTIDIPTDALSKSAVQLLLSAVQNEKPGLELTLATELIVRKSTGPPANTTRRPSEGPGRHSPK